MSTVLSRSRPTARKEHLCESCGRRITTGETYSRVKSVDDWGMRTWKECLQCVSLASDLWNADYRGEGENGEEVYAYLPEVDWADVATWSPLWALRAERYRQRWAGQPYPNGDQP